MKLETIIEAWERAGWQMDAYMSCESGGGNARYRRKKRQRQKFWEHIVKHIEEYRTCYLENATRSISAYCARDDAGFWPYRKSHAIFINNLVAAGIMRLSQLDPARWRFESK